MDIMNKNMIVSVIIPTYGKPDFLSAAIDSVLNQSLPANEIIVVDDNGMGTENQKLTESLILEKYSEDVIYIALEKNMNGSAARNTGISAAKSKYIALLDDDDRFLSKKLELQANVMNDLSEDFKICFSAYIEESPDGYREERYCGDLSDSALDIFLGSHYIPSSGLMFTKRAWEQVNGFDESFKRHQDWEFVIRMSGICVTSKVDEICWIKHMVKRNKVREPGLYKEYRLHFLNKMDAYISRYPKKISIRIHRRHKVDIILEYLKNKEFKLAAKELKDSNGKLMVEMICAVRIMKYFLRRRWVSKKQ